MKLALRDCVCDSGHEWCCNNKRTAKRRGLSGIVGSGGGPRRSLGNYIQVGDDEEKCKDGSTPGIWGCTDTGVSTDPTLFESFANLFKPAPPPKPSATAQAASAAAKVIIGGIQGAAAQQVAAQQAALMAQQAAQRNKQIQMIAILGVVGLGAFMILGRD